MNKHDTNTLEGLEQTLINLKATLALLARQEPSTDEQIQQYTADMPWTLGMCADMAEQALIPFINGTVTVVDPLEEQQAS